MEHLDCVVIGAGVVGLATARRLALDGRRVVVFEAEAAVGAHASSHNSGVVHAGVYYATGSLKARLCVSGREALFAYAARRGIPHQRVGKLMVAVEEREIATLERIAQLGRANGVDDLVTLSGDDVKALEPQVEAVRAVLSPSTGIIDTEILVARLRADLEAAGGTVELSRPVTRGRVTNAGIELDGTVRAKTVVNAAGTCAPRVAAAIEGLARVPTAYFAPGHYFALTGASPVRHLVYPMPSPGVAHIHLSIDQRGRARLGPDLSWTDTPSYRFDTERRAAFHQAVQRYLPHVTEDQLEPDGVGIRAKVVPDGSPPADFAIEGPEVHGVRGLVNLFGIESPGLTACLAIADEVALRC